MNKFIFIICISFCFSFLSNNNLQGQNIESFLLPDSVTVPLLIMQDSSFANMLDSFQQQGRKCYFSQIGISNYIRVIFLDQENAEKNLRMGYLQIGTFFMQRSLAKIEIRGVLYYNNDLVVIRIKDNCNWCEEKYNQIFRKTDTLLTLNFFTIAEEPRYINSNHTLYTRQNSLYFDYIYVFYKEENGIFKLIEEDNCDINTDKQQTKKTE